MIATPVCVGLAWLTLGRMLLRSSRQDLAIMVFLGLMLILYQWFYLAAVDRLGVSAATLVLVCVPPVLVAVVSAAFLRELPSPRLALALVVALVGTALLVAR
ncbi:MAG: EamA family transporter, partial [Chloroflexota bacterium]|nr:EamA family transporter [Chloroflexota bacterium]